MISVDYEQVVYNGNGSQTAWPYSFPIYDGDVVRLILLDADGTETDITQDYFVDVPGSTVYYPGYAAGAEPPEADQPPKVQPGQKLIVYRDTEITQDSNLGKSWPFNVIEKGLDKLTMILQEKAFALARCLKISQGQAAEIDDYDTTVPLAADKVICGNADGNGFEAREAMMEVNGAWDGEGRQIHSVADPTADQDAATKKYADTRMDGNFMKLQADGTGWEGRNLPIRNVTGPASVKDVANKDYVDRILAGYSGQGERFVFFDNVAQMKAAELVPSQMAVTLGYHDVNDGGAGVYTIRDIGADTPDEGSLIAITGTSYAAELITDGTVNVKQFGAWGCANEYPYINITTHKRYKTVDISGSTVAGYIDNVTSPYNKHYVSASFTDEGVYEYDSKHWYSATATEAPYEDNVDGGWYVSATFTDEGTYEYDDKHWYDAGHTIEAPYYDNVADKWYVTATYSDEGTYTYNSKYWYITDAVEAAYLDNVASKWYVSATYANEANYNTVGVWYYGAVFSEECPDDTAAIQAAVNAATQVVYLPKGEYVVTDTIQFPNRIITMLGDGQAKKNSSLIWSNGANPVIAVKKEWSSIQGINFVDVAATIDTFGSDSIATCIDASAIPYTRFKDCTFYGYNFGIYYAANSWCDTLKHCYFEYCNTGFLAGGEFNCATIFDCVLLACGVGASINGGRTVYFNNCVIEQNNKGITTQNTNANVIIDACYFENNNCSVDIIWALGAPRETVIQNSSFFANATRANTIHYAGNITCKVIINNNAFYESTTLVSGVCVSRATNGKVWVYFNNNNLSPKYTVGDTSLYIAIDGSIRERLFFSNVTFSQYFNNNAAHSTYSVGEHIVIKAKLNVAENLNAGTEYPVCTMPQEVIDKLSVIQNPTSTNTSVMSLTTNGKVFRLILKPTGDLVVYTKDAISLGDVILTELVV